MIGGLRRYAETDLGDVRALHKASFAVLAKYHHDSDEIAAHLALIDSAPYAADVARSHLLLQDDELGLAATAGWLRLDGEPDTARIRKVFVRPDRARLGLGRAMVVEAEKDALSDGCRRFFVRANVNAVPLYLKMGYTPVEEGRMEVAAGISLPVVFMRKG